MHVTSALLWLRTIVRVCFVSLARFLLCSPIAVSSTHDLDTHMISQFFTCVFVRIPVYYPHLCTRSRTSSVLYLQLELISS